MGKLNIPPTSDPAMPGRKAPHSAGVGNETSADMDGALGSNPGPGTKRNTGDKNLGFDSGEIHKALS